MSVQRPQNPAAETRDPLPMDMRAVARSRYGSVAQVAGGRVERPCPGKGEVLVKVAAAGLDRATLHLLEGKPYLARLALGVRRPRRSVLGQQVAGEVVALGDGVTELALGERVFGTAAGSFAEYAVAKAAALARTPEGVPDATAATLGVSGLTAHGALVDRGRVQAGQTVLVLGASGAVGTYAVQLAAHLGARVTGVCSGGKMDLVRSLGAEQAADYTTTALADLGTAFDVIIDIAGNRRLRELQSALTPTGTLVIVGGEQGGPLLGGIQRNLLAAITDRLVRQRLTWLFSAPTTQGLAELAAVVDEGRIQPPVDREVDLAGVPAAISSMQRGELRGHVIVRP